MIEKFYKNVVREYGEDSLKRKDLHENPLQELEHWLNDAVNLKLIDANAAVLATTEGTQPDTRIILIKEITAQGLVFYTNYNSTKAQQIAKNNQVACNFYWPQLVRQVRIQGVCAKVPQEQSADYFSTRSRSSQASAIVSNQSQLLTNQEALEAKVQKLVESNSKLTCPEYWGGYLLIPTKFEFWQGRDQRLHDRFLYEPNNKQWVIKQLAP